MHGCNNFSGRVVCFWKTSTRQMRCYTRYHREEAKQLHTARGWESRRPPQSRARMTTKQPIEVEDAVHPWPARSTVPRSQPTNQPTQVTNRAATAANVRPPPPMAFTHDRHDAAEPRAAAAGTARGGILPKPAAFSAGHTTAHSRTDVHAGCRPPPARAPPPPWHRRGTRRPAANGRAPERCRCGIYIKYSSSLPNKRHELINKRWSCPLHDVTACACLPSTLGYSSITSSGKHLFIGEDKQQQEQRRRPAGFSPRRRRLQ